MSIYIHFERNYHKFIWQNYFKYNIVVLELILWGKCNGNKTLRNIIKQETHKFIFLNAQW